MSSRVRLMRGSYLFSAVSVDPLTNIFAPLSFRGSANRRVANVTTVGQEAIQSFGELSGKKKVASLLTEALRELQAAGRITTLPDTMRMQTTTSVQQPD
jgi:hypothetical protein